MQDQRDYLQHSFELKPAVPNGINVLSILSFIGSGFQILGGIAAYLIIPFSAKSVPETRGLEKTREMKPFSGFLQWSADATLKQYEYRLPILIVTIITALVCIYGVLQMRKLKKQGFAFYSSAELALPLFTAVVIDIWSAIFGFVIAILFIILFGAQRKYLVQ
ncbi:hypothetical protein WG954_21600 [Lacibacter sp. H375]|uniref:hypothetical protein n=1 Tax=Lacibacter sp. H375 TaxID=3133424 RepID=UPI0030C28132